MPPAGRRRPDLATRTAFVSRLEAALDRAAAATPNPGRPAALHRLNRAEFVNVVRDLLALDIDGAALLPPDTTGYGFDNNADVLSLSPSLLDRYLLAAEKISQLAVGNVRMRPDVVSYSLPRELRQGDARMSEDLPFGSRGGTAVRHTFPVDGEYEVSLRMQRSAGVTFPGQIRGLTDPTEIDLRVDGKRVKLFDFVGERAVVASSFGVQYPPPQDNDKILVVRVPVKAGPRLVGVSFNRKATVPEGRGPSREATAAVNQPMPGRRSSASQSPDRSTPGRHGRRRKRLRAGGFSAVTRRPPRKNCRVRRRSCQRSPGVRIAGRLRTKICRRYWRSTRPAAKRRASTRGFG